MGGQDFVGFMRNQNIENFEGLVNDSQPPDAESSNQNSERFFGL